MVQWRIARYWAVCFSQTKLNYSAFGHLWKRLIPIMSRNGLVIRIIYLLVRNGSAVALVIKNTYILWKAIEKEIVNSRFPVLICADKLTLAPLTELSIQVRLKGYIDVITGSAWWNPSSRHALHSKILSTIWNSVRTSFSDVNQICTASQIFWRASVMVSYH